MLAPKHKAVYMYSMAKLTKTLSVRVRDRHAAALTRQANAVNFVWNYINELSYRSVRERGVFLSKYDFHPYTTGSAKMLGLHSQTVQCIAAEYATRRKQFKKAKLRWRKSRGAKRSLGWIPINSGAASWKNGQVYFNGNHYKVWDSYGLSQYKFRSACFTEDARGRWYFNVAVEVKLEKGKGKSAVGIDLGCKTAATDSNGHVLAGRNYRKLKEDLGVAQRAGKRNRVRAIHVKIKNCRKDEQHKYSRKLVNENAAIFVGNVSSTWLAKTKMAKSVLDAGWGQLRTMLEYKCAMAGLVFEVIDEAYSTVTCSDCKKRTGPSGQEGLRIREWTCCECGAAHDRDVNAARNILALGHERLAGGKVAA
jgi:IS605 OrfB family transposase